MSKGIFNTCLLLILTLHLIAPESKGQKTDAFFVEADNPNIQIFARYLAKDDGKTIQLHMPGSSIRMRFTGTSIAVKLRKAGDDICNVYGIIDSDYENPVTINPTRFDSIYKIASGLKDSIHVVEIHRLQDVRYPVLEFKGFSLPSDEEVLAPPSPPLKKIEFYGNSITVGGQMPDLGYTHNNFYAYGSVCARMLGAEYRCIAKSGIGITSSYNQTLASELYDQILHNTDSAWNFQIWIPQVVIINLGQNDFSLGVDIEKWKLNYAEYVHILRMQYPNAEIICSIGSMTSSKPSNPYAKAIEEYVRSRKDRMLHFLRFPWMGTTQHPTREQHQDMANILVSFIDSLDINWNMKPSRFALFLENAENEGVYEKDEIVYLKADTPLAGQVFSSWKGDTAFVEDIYSPETKITMPAKNIKLSACYSDNPDVKQIKIKPETDLYLAGENRFNTTDLFVEYRRYLTVLRFTVENMDYFVDSSLLRLYKENEEGFSTVSVNTTWQQIWNGDIIPSSEMSRINLFAGNFEMDMHQSDVIEFGLNSINWRNGELTLRLSGARGGDLVSFYSSETDQSPMLIIFQDTTREVFQLTVNQGSGSGLYEMDSLVTITAISSEEGMQFSEWSGDIEYIEDVSNPATFLTMPGHPVSIEANFTHTTEADAHPMDEGPNIIQDHRSRLLTITLPGNAVHLHFNIYTLSGKIILSGEVYENDNQIDMNAFQRGGYILHLHSDNIHSTKKFFLF